MGVQPVGPLARALAAALCRLEVEGSHRLPWAGPAVVMVNHTVTVDVVPVLAALDQAGLRPAPPCPGGCAPGHGHVRFLATEDLWRNPVTGPLVATTGFIPTPFGAPGTVAYRAALRALHDGEVLGIYPEGDASGDGDGSPRPFLPGVARLARRTGAVVVPLAQRDARAIAPPLLGIGRTVLRALGSTVRRPVVRVRVGEPVTPPEWADLDERATLDLLRDALTRTWESADPGKPGDLWDTGG